MIVLTIKFIVELVRLVELLESKDDNEKNDEVDEDIGNPHGCESITNLVSGWEVIALRPQQDVEQCVCYWDQHQKLNENVPPFFDCAYDDIHNSADGANEHQEK